MLSSVPPTPELYYSKISRVPRFRTEANARRLIKCVAHKHGVPVEAIYGRSRKQKYLAARFEAYWWIVTRMDMGYEWATQIFNKDASSIFEAIKAYIKQRKETGRV